MTSAPARALTVTDLVATDLDRTLLWSRRRAGVTPEALADLVCLEVLAGEQHAFVTAKASAAIEDLAATGALVPVTTRTPRQVGRIALPRVPWLLCLNGGVLLVDGRPDPEHARGTADLVAQVRPMPEFLDRVATLAEAPHVRGLRDADGHFCYFLLSGDPVTEDWVEELQAIATDDDWVVTQEQSKIYVMPRTLTKENGLRRLLDRTGGRLLAAAGDSRLDEGMLRLAERALVPRGSYLESHGWDGDLTSATGVRAGEEIALWLWEHAPGPATAPTA